MAKRKPHIFGWQQVALRHGWPQHELDYVLKSLEQSVTFYVMEITAYRIVLTEVRATARMVPADPDRLGAFLKKYGLQAAPSSIEYEIDREFRWYPTPTSIQTAPAKEDPWCPSHELACEPVGWLKCGATGIVGFETCMCGRVHNPGCEILKQRKEYHDKAARLALAAAVERSSAEAARLAKPAIVVHKPVKLDRKRVLPGQLKLL